MKKQKILVLIRKFDKIYPKHKHLFDSIAALEKFAEVQYWYKDGDINEILKKINFKPDFIFHYDIGYNYGLAPKIIGLEKINIPKGCYVIDAHWNPKYRMNYFKNNNIDLIFSASKDTFLKVYSQYESKFRWMPFSINSDIIKDWKANKDIDFLLMGQVYYKNCRNLVYKGKYTFREAVYNKMKEEKGFVFIPHPGHTTKGGPYVMINDKYGKLLNRAKIFFTCGGVKGYPVAKFIETLGCKTLLLAKPNKDILELGFKDGLNFVSCDELDFYDKAMYYIKNEEEREKISSNGYNFIHAYHTNEIRAQQVIKYIEDYITGQNKL